MDSQSSIEPLSSSAVAASSKAAAAPRVIDSRRWLVPPGSSGSVESEGMGVGWVDSPKVMNEELSFIPSHRKIERPPGHGDSFPARGI